MQIVKRKTIVDVLNFAPLFSVFRFSFYYAFLPARLPDAGYFTLVGEFPKTDPAKIERS